MVAKNENSAGDDYEKLFSLVSKKPISCFKQYISSFDVENESERKNITLDQSYDAQITSKTICLVEFNNGESRICALGWIEKTGAFTTYKQKVWIKLFGNISFKSLNEIAACITDAKLKNLFLKTIENGTLLTPKVSQAILEVLSVNDGAFLRKALAETDVNIVTEIQFEQDDALDFALKAFGIPFKKKDNYIVEKLNEDLVISNDAHQIDGYFKTYQSDFGKTVFAKDSIDYLSVYMANKQLLEQMLGIDLIYVNEVCGNMVMVQYKMLQPQKVKYGYDWVFYPDKQTEKEIDRMKLPQTSDIHKDYRLNSNPFYFRFVKRNPRLVSDGVRTFNITVDHYNRIINSTKGQGQKGGIRISYESLNATYLRETEFIALIHSGYIGTYSVDTKYLQTIIEQVIKGNRSLVVAWQHKMGKN